MAPATVPNTLTVRVLLLEDNPADIEFVQRCLKDHGHPLLELVRATRLSEAVAVLKEQSFHLIITDLNLPDAEGLQTFFKLKELSPDSAFVVMTGVEDRDAGMQAMRSGAQDYIVKGDAGPQRIWQSIRNALVRQGILRRVSSSAKELHEVNTRLQTLSTADPLTGLYNRRGFDERLAQETARAEANGLENCVLLVDIDDFKQVNDRLGHDQGDLALLEVTRRLQERLRPGDFAARVGGDEFMVLLPGTSVEHATEVAERIRLAVEDQLVPSAAKAFGVTVSVGVARQGSSAASAHELLARTHRALTLSKQGGKNRVSYDEGSPVDLSLKSVGSARVLKRGFFRIADGKISGCEFLCRSRPKADPAASDLVAPLPKALEGFGLCVQAATQLAPDLECHIRLCHTDLKGLQPGDLLRLLPPNFDAKLLRLEVRGLTYTPLSPPVLATLQALRKHGIRLVLQDTDLKLLPLSSLLQLEADWIKISRRWLHGIAGDPAKERALQALLKAIRGLGARAMAGGVEAWEDLEVLRRLGVHHGQGPLWSHHS